MYAPVGGEEGGEERHLSRVLISVGDRLAVDEGHPEDLALLLPGVLNQEGGEKLGAAGHLKPNVNKGLQRIVYGANKGCHL